VERGTAPHTASVAGLPLRCVSITVRSPAVCAAWPPPPFPRSLPPVHACWPPTRRYGICSPTHWTPTHKHTEAPNKYLVRQQTSRQREMYLVDGARAAPPMHRPSSSSNSSSSWACPVPSTPHPHPSRSAAEGRRVRACVREYAPRPRQAGPNICSIVVCVG
jgi:hypothetical protein